MDSEVLLDAGAVSRCRRRVHLDHDPGSMPRPLLPPNQLAEQRSADRAAHRLAIQQLLLKTTKAPNQWFVVSRELSTAQRVRNTIHAIEAKAAFIWDARLPSQRKEHRRGEIDLLVRVDRGYVPILIARHRVTDPGQGAYTTDLHNLDPRQAKLDSTRKVRAQPRDQLRLAHAYRMLLSLGIAEPGNTLAGVIGFDADVVLWHDLQAQTWPGGRDALTEYDVRFTDRLAVAFAALNRQEPLAQPSRVTECRNCPWWSRCEPALQASRDVSLVMPGDEAVALRKAGISTVEQLANFSTQDEPPQPWSSEIFFRHVALAKAWLADLVVVRTVVKPIVPRADVEVDIDMESFSDSGVYLWGCLLSGADIDLPQGYHAFHTWDPLPCADEARSFAEFWAWLTQVRDRAAAAGLSFRAYCYNALAENRWLFASAQRFAGYPGVPTVAQVRAFTTSAEWVDLFRAVTDQFLCVQGKGLKVIAPITGFQWRDLEASGEASMHWYRDAVGLDGQPTDLSQRQRLLEYNEDDVRATQVLRTWISQSATTVPFIEDL